jgi:hypothetical protein
MLSIQLQLRMAPVEKDECQNTAIKKITGVDRIYIYLMCHQCLVSIRD